MAAAYAAFQTAVPSPVTYAYSCAVDAMLSQKLRPRYDTYICNTKVQRGTRVPLWPLGTLHIVPAVRAVERRR